MQTRNRHIPITYAGKSGKTPLSSFDAALYGAGVGNLNLVHLSSVIPTGRQPVTDIECDHNHANHGDRLYCVYAAQTVVDFGKTAAAGLGWVMTQDDANQAWGLFVEHVGESEEDVVEQIHGSLQYMTSYRTDSTWGAIQHCTTSVSCEGDPVTALVIAHYQLTAWENSVNH